MLNINAAVDAIAFRQAGLVFNAVFAFEFVILNVGLGPKKSPIF